VIKKQLGGMFTQDVCGFFRKQGIGYDNKGGRS
jgi:hypothetical protein